MNPGNPPSPAPRRRKWNNEPLVLFVEGYSDLTFYAEVLEHAGCKAGDYFIQDIGGKTKLEIDALLLLKPDNLASMAAVGVILDADSELGADPTFESARRALRNATGVEVPGLGEWFQKGGSGPWYGIFVVGGEPDLVEVESLAWKSWASAPENQEFRKCVEAYATCAEACGQKLQSRDKVRIGALLSVLNEEDPRLGPSARRGVFQLESPCFASLLAFFKGMIARRDAQGTPNR